jgi:hypothetical protein
MECVGAVIELDQKIGKLEKLVNISYENELENIHVGIAKEIVTNNPTSTGNRLNSANEDIYKERLSSEKSFLKRLNLLFNKPTLSSNNAKKNPLCGFRFFKIMILITLAIIALSIVGILIVQILKHTSDETSNYDSSSNDINQTPKPQFNLIDDFELSIKNNFFVQFAHMNFKNTYFHKIIKS